MYGTYVVKISMAVCGVNEVFLWQIPGMFKNSSVIQKPHMYIA